MGLKNFATYTSDNQVLWGHIYVDSRDRRYEHVSTTREVDSDFESAHPELKYVYTAYATPFTASRYLRGINLTCIDDHYIVKDNKAVFF